MYDEEDMLRDGDFEKGRDEPPFGELVDGWYYGTGMKPDDF
jgi:hypothetical protein